MLQHTLRLRRSLADQFVRQSRPILRHLVPGPLLRPLAPGLRQCLPPLVVVDQINHLVGHAVAELGGYWPQTFVQRIAASPYASVISYQDAGASRCLWQCRLPRADEHAAASGELRKANT